MNTKQKHTHYYISLCLILGMGLAIILLAGEDRQLRMLGVLLTAFFYVLWGLVHHIIHHDTSIRIVVEYVLIGALGIILALLVH